MHCGLRAGAAGGRPHLGRRRIQFRLDPEAPSTRLRHRSCSLVVLPNSPRSFSHGRKSRLVLTKAFGYVPVRMDADAVPRKLWEHGSPESTLMYRFMEEVNQKQRLQLKVVLPGVG